MVITQAGNKQKNVNHKDGNKGNNHISKIEWRTAKENEQHSYDTLGKQSWDKVTKGLLQGAPNPVWRLSKEGVLEKEYNSPIDAEEDGYNLKQILAVCNGNQKHIKIKYGNIRNNNESSNNNEYTRNGSGGKR